MTAAVSSPPTHSTPIEAACRAKLEEAGEGSETLKSPILHLALWGMETLEFKDSAMQYRLEQRLGDLAMLPSEKLLASWYPDPARHAEIARHLRSLPPAEAAQSVLEDLAGEKSLL